SPGKVGQCWSVRPPTPLGRGHDQGVAVDLPQARTETELVSTERMSDGYDIHYRLWGARTGSDLLVVLRGGMDHSAWQRPLAQSVRATFPDIRFRPCPTRLRSQWHARRYVSALRSIEDVVERTCSPAGWRIHLAGWCEAVSSLRSQHSVCT